MTLIYVAYDKKRNKLVATVRKDETGTYILKAGDSTKTFTTQEEAFVEFTKIAQEGMYEIPGN